MKAQWFDDQAVKAVAGVPCSQAIAGMGLFWRTNLDPVSFAILQ